MASTFRSDPFMLDEDIAAEEEPSPPPRPPITPAAAPEPENTVAPPPRPVPSPKPVAPPAAVAVPAAKPAKPTAKRRGRPPSDNPKKQITLRLDAEIIAHFKAQGRGWQTRLNQALREAVGL